MLAALCGCVQWPVGVGAAQPFDPLESAREALAGPRDYPWYDADTDQLRRIDIAPGQDDSQRLSRWAKQRRQPLGSRDQAGGSLFWSILRGIAWVALGLLAALVMWGLMWAALRGGVVEESREEAGEAVTDSKRRIQELPVSVSPAHANLLEAARRHVKRGDLSNAIIHAFAHQLVELDKHHLIQLNKGKTNREYLGELRRHPEFVPLLRPTMSAFEDVFFGHHEISRERFQACWDHLDRFHQQLRESAS